MSEPTDLYIAAHSLRSKGRALALWADDILAGEEPADALEGIRSIARWLRDDIRELERAMAPQPDARLARRKALGHQ